MDKWKFVEKYHDTVLVDNLKVYSAGVMYQHIDGKTQVIGASCGENQQENYLRLALFEAQERMIIWENYHLKAKFFKEDYFFTDKKEIKNPFLKSNLLTWDYAKSNGVALYKTPEVAKMKAALELIERDAVFLSWVFKNAPKKIDSNIFESLQLKVKNDYKLEIFEFESRVDGVFVFGVFFFPLKKELNPVFGFSANFRADLALYGAKKEAVQRLAFLFDATADEKISATPSANFHQEYYLGERGTSLLKEWVYGESFDYKLKKIDFLSIEYIRLYSRDDLYVYKAVSADLEPLRFGKDFVAFSDKFISDVHPIA